MDLIPVLTVEIATDGESFTFADETASDNQSTSTNYWNGSTTRYNLNISKNTSNATEPDQVYESYLKITDPDGNEFEFDVFDVPKTTSDYVFENSDIDQTGVIPDGVYIFDYILKNRLTSFGGFSVTEGSPVMTFNTSTPASLEVDMVIASNGTFVTIESITSTTVTVDSDFESTTTGTILDVGYLFRKYFLFDFNTRCCIDRAVARAAVESCCNDCLSDGLKNATNLYMLLTGATAQVNNGNYQEAQDTIDLISTICATEQFSCGCS